MRGVAPCQQESGDRLQLRAGRCNGRARERRSVRLQGTDWRKGPESDQVHPPAETRCRRKRGRERRRATGQGRSEGSRPISPQFEDRTHVMKTGRGEPEIAAPALFVFCRARMRLLWSGGRFLGEFLLDARGKGLDAFDVGGGSPEFLVGIPLAVGKHAGAANAVL